MKSKIYTLFIFCLILAENIVAQNDTLVKNSPFSFETSYLGDVVNNLSGGIKKGSCYLGMANMKITFDFEKAQLWKGGQLFINAANTHGNTPSADLVGDFQTFSNIETDNLTYLHELWYKQNVGKASFVIGLQDLAVEFLSSENAALFLNSSFGVHSTIAHNLPVPIFPLTSLGAQFHYSFSDKIIAKIAVFDGLPDNFDVNPHNTIWKLQKNDGYFSFSEISYQNASEKLSGTYKIGGYYHNPHKVETELESEKIIEEHAENYGFYATIDQTILNTSNGKQLSIFSQASISPKTLNENWYYLGFGLNYKGLLSKRTDDILGFAVAHTGLKNRRAETAFELTYKVQIGENIFIQPDFQYIINPSGTDEKLKNAFVANLRFGINF